MHRRKTDGSSFPRPVDRRDDIKEAWAAQRDVRDRFVDAAEQGAEVRRIADEFRVIRERNGFGYLIKKSMGLQ